VWTGGPRSWRSISAVEHCLSNCKPLKQAPSKSWPWWLSSVCAANGFVPFHALEISTYASARQADCFFLQTHQPTGVNQPTGRCTTAFLGHFRSNTLARTTAVVAPCCTSETPRAPHRWPGKPGPSLNRGKRSLAIGQLSSKASQLGSAGLSLAAGVSPPPQTHQPWHTKLPNPVLEPLRSAFGRRRSLKGRRKLEVGHATMHSRSP